MKKIIAISLCVFSINCVAVDFGIRDIKANSELKISLEKLPEASEKPAMKCFFTSDPQQVEDGTTGFQNVDWRWIGCRKASAPGGPFKVVFGQEECEYLCLKKKKNPILFFKNKSPRNIKVYCYSLPNYDMSCV